jgi:hypothetical protein
MYFHASSRYDYGAACHVQEKRKEMTTRQRVRYRKRLKEMTMRQRVVYSKRKYKNYEA